MAFSLSRRVSLLPRSFYRAESQERKRFTTYPLANSSRKKDRRWPLVLRFWKGSIHGTILLPVTLHAVLAAVVVFINSQINSDFNLPSSIIPSLSIVVGLMLVFRNQTAYSRFWNGRCHLSTVTTAIRCISRQILVLVPPPASPYPGLHSIASNDSLLNPSRNPLNADRASSSGEGALPKADELKTIETVKILIAMLYTIKNHLRAEWGVALSPGTSLTKDGQEATDSAEYKDLLPPGLKGYEHRGLGLTLELATFIERFIATGVKKEWFHNAASGSMLSQLDALTSAYGSMEVIRLVPIPVAHLIHHKQTLALFCGILPFAMASEMDWWAVPLVAFVAFTLYGIEGIAQTYEDPFGVAKIDINMDDIVEDARQEVEVLLTAWQTQGPSVSGQDSIFRPRVGETIISEDSSLSEFYSGDVEREPVRKAASQVRFVVSDMSDRRYKDLDDNATEGMEIGNREVRTGRMSSSISPGDVSKGSSNYFDVA